MPKTKRPDFSGIQYRALSFVPATLNTESRSVEAVLASETPVMEIDYERMCMCPTVLLMSGCKLPKNRSIVLLDAHQRSGPVAQNIKGSANEISVKGTELVGRLDFSALAKDEWTLASEGNLKDVSIGRTDEKQVYVPDKQTIRLEGREFTGPMRVVTSWTPREVSLTPIGADPTAKLRQLQEEGADPDPEPAGRAIGSAQFGSSIMEPLFKAFLFGRGLAETSTDEQIVTALHGVGMPKETEADKVRAWVEANLPKVNFKPATPPVVDRAAAVAALVPGEIRIEGSAFDPEKLAAGIYEKLEAKRAAAEATQIKVREHAALEGKKLGLSPDAIATVSNCTSIDAANRALLDAMAARQAPGFQIGNVAEVRFGRDQMDKFANTCRTAWSLSCLRSQGFKETTIDKVFPVTRREQGWEQFADYSPMMMARQCVEAMGIRASGMTNIQIAKAAFGGRNIDGFNIHERASAYHTTGSFPNVTLDAINKVMAAAYAETETSYQTCFRKAASVPDFKQKNVIRMGAQPNLDVWPEDSPIPQGTVKDEREYYSVEAYAKRFTISWRALINDDQDAFGFIPASQARAARRTIDQFIWGMLTSNPLMQDGVALFSAVTGNRLKSNLTTGAGAPSVLTLQTLTAKMRAMRGVNTSQETLPDDFAGARPRYLIVPPELATTAAQLVLSIADPAGNQAGIYNPARYLEVVVVDYLSASSTTAWYLASDPMLTPGAEYTFLQGQEQPDISSHVDPDTWSMCFDVVQSFGAKFTDFRGWQRHDGA